MNHSALADRGMSSGVTPEDRDRIAARLEDGWKRITEAEAVGADVAEWEEFWTKLLQEYEAACRELDAISLPATPAVTEEQMSMGGW